MRIRSVATLFLLALAACSGPPGVGWPSVSDPGITVECRTVPEAPAGECLGWAETVLDGLPDDVPRSDRLVLTGPLGPSSEPAVCTAAFVGLMGRAVFTAQVDCWVPSGG